MEQKNISESTEIQPENHDKSLKPLYIVAQNSQNQEQIVYQTISNDDTVNLPKIKEIKKKIQNNASDSEVVLIKKSFLPKITKNLVKTDDHLVSQWRTNKKNVNSSKQIKEAIIFNNKEKRTIFRNSKSVQLTKAKEKTVKDQLYLPAFIRNFELPPKKKIEIVPTMDTFKKREQSIRPFLSPIEQLKKYKVLSHIGKGSFSIVSQAMNIETQRKCAIKTYVKLDQIQEYKFTNIEREIQNMQRLDQHRNVARIECVIMDKRKILLIMENCGQQSLAGILRKRKVFPQMLAKTYFKQIMEGIQYCHENSICHRDLKLQNILIDDFNCIKIIDFGFSCATTKLLSSFCGTPPYMPPQIVSKKLYEGKGADIWSLGVILYLMLYGCFPFKSIHETQLFRLIQQGKILHNQSISAEAKDVINLMLKTNTSERATASEVLSNKWLHS